MKKLAVLLVGAMALGSCRHAAPFVGPNGQQGYSVDCSGTAVSMASCYQQASRLCPNGYDPIGQSNQRGNAFIPNVGVVPTSNKSLEFVCIGPAAAVPTPIPRPTTPANSHAELTPGGEVIWVPNN